MSKKILSLVLSLTMVLSLFVVTTTVNASEVLSEGAITDMNLYQDFESDLTAFTTGSGAFEIVEETDNESNTVLDLTPANGQISVAAEDTGIGDMDKFVFEFDVKKNYASGTVLVGFKHPQYGNYGIVIFPGAFIDMQLVNPSIAQSETNVAIPKPGVSINPETWSTVRVTVDYKTLTEKLDVLGKQGWFFNYSGPIESFTNANGTSMSVPTTNSHAINLVLSHTTVEIKDENDSEWTSLEKIAGSSYAYKKAVRFNSGTAVFPASVNGKDIAITAQKDTTWYGSAALPNGDGTYTGVGANASWQIDNIKLYNIADTTTISKVKFFDENGEQLSEIPEGEVKAKFDVANFGGFTSADAVIAAYDVNDEMLKKIVTNVSLGEGFVTAEATIDVSAYYDYLTDGGRIEAFLWNTVDDMIPVGSISGVIGSKSTVEASTTSANLATNGTEKTYSFTNVDRSTFVNKITVEGIHSAGKAVPVTLKIAGKDSGEKIVLSQFVTNSDGSFSKDFLLNPKFCTADNEATVTLSGIDTTSASFDIPVFSNWGDMMEDFMRFDAESVEEY